MPSRFNLLKKILGSTDDVARIAERDAAEDLLRREARQVDLEHAFSNQVPAADSYGAFADKYDPNFTLSDVPNSRPVSPNQSLALPGERGMTNAPNFRLEGEPYTNFSTEAGPRAAGGLPTTTGVSGLPAPRGATDLVSQIPNEIRDVTPILPKSGFPWGKAAKYGTGAGALGLLGYSFLGGDENQDLPPIPLRTEQPQPTPEQPVEGGRAKAAVATKATGGAGMSKSSGKQDMPMSIDFGSGFKDTAENLEDVQQRQNLAVLANQLGRAGSQIGASIAGVQPGDLSGFDTNIKMSGQITEQYKARMEKEKNDPNSPLSKGMKQFMKSFGFDVKGDATAEELMKLSPLAEKYFNAMENRELRREQMQIQAQNAALKREELKANKEIAIDQKDRARVDKFVESAQKRMGKEFEKLQTIENALHQIESASGDQIGSSDVAILYNFIKALDPTSVVKEGEVALARIGQSLKGKLRTATIGQLRGELMDDNFRQGVITIARRLAEKGTTSYNDAVQNIRDTGIQRYGMTEEELGQIDPLLNRQAREKNDLTDVQKAKIEAFMKTNNIKSEAEAAKILKEHGKL